MFVKFSLSRYLNNQYDIWYTYGYKKEYNTLQRIRGIGAMSQYGEGGGKYVPMYVI